jgi:hypothetical protein
MKGAEALGSLWPCGLSSRMLTFTSVAADPVWTGTVAQAVNFRSFMEPMMVVERGSAGIMGM